MCHHHSECCPFVQRNNFHPADFSYSLSFGFLTQKMCLCWILNCILIFWVSLGLCINFKLIVRSGLWIFILIQKLLEKYCQIMKYYVVYLVFRNYFFFYNEL